MRKVYTEYSKLDTPNSSKKTQVEFVKIQSDHIIDSNVDDGQPGIEVDEDPIYANEVERLALLLISFHMLTVTITNLSLKATVNDFY